MQIHTVLAAAALLVFVGAAPARSADVSAGRTAFRLQCALCHSAEPNDGGGGDAPNLMTVVGRHAAGLPNYPYSKALTNSGLTWDPATLDRFLSAPAAMVPGSAMRTAVTEQDTRANIVAYLQSVSATHPAANVAPTLAMPHPKAGSEDWRQEGAGRGGRGE